MLLLICTSLHIPPSEANEPNRIGRRAEGGKGDRAVDVGTAVVVVLHGGVAEERGSTLLAAWLDGLCVRWEEEEEECLLMLPPLPRERELEKGRGDCINVTLAEKEGEEMGNGDEGRGRASFSNCTFGEVIKWKGDDDGDAGVRREGGWKEGR